MSAIHVSFTVAERDDIDEARNRLERFLVLCIDRRERAPDEETVDDLLEIMRRDLETIDKVFEGADARHESGRAR